MMHHFSNAMARLGHDVFVVGPAGSHIPDGWSAEYSLIVDENARPQAREGREWVEEEFPRLESFFHELWQKHDFDRAIAVHPFYYAPPLQAVGKAFGRPVAIIFHGYELRSQLMRRARRHEGQMRRGRHGPTVRTTTLEAAREADEILVNSSYTQSLVRRSGTQAPIRVIGCGVDRQRAEAELSRSADEAAGWRREVRERLAIPAAAPVVGTIGRLVRSKNPADLVRLLKRNKDIYALIGGEGPERGPIKAAAKAAGVDSRLRLVDDVGEAEKWKLLRALDIFCLLSTPTSLGEVEGFGIVLLEASLAGVPVIAARAGGMVDVVTHKQTGVVVPRRDIRSLDRAVRWLNENPDQASACVERARQNILQRFNFDVISRRLSSEWQLGGTLSS